MHYFIDTSFFVAIANTDDKYHTHAVSRLVELSKTHNTKLTTSDYVLDEFFLILMRKRGIATALTWTYNIVEHKFCIIHYCNQNIFLSALEVFRSEQFERKPLTFTDAVVYVSNQLLNCDGILTYDNRLQNFS